VLSHWSCYWVFRNDWQHALLLEMLNVFPFTLDTVLFPTRVCDRTYLEPAYEAWYTVEFICCILPNAVSLGYYMYFNSKNIVRRSHIPSWKWASAQNSMLACIRCWRCHSFYICMYFVRNWIIAVRAKTAQQRKKYTAWSKQHHTVSPTQLYIFFGKRYTFRIE
jgi:hypothetical protein